MTSFNKITHCIFDLDGLLVNSEPIYEQINNEIIEQFNAIYTDEVKFKVRGRTERMSAEVIVNSLNLPISVDDYLRMFREKCLGRLENVQLMPGAERLVKHLAKNNIPIAVATSSNLESLACKTKKHQEVFKLFHHFVSGADDPDVKESKPHPDIFLVAAKRFDDQPKPDKCLVLEDAPNGITAAHAAGMQSVLVPDSRVPKEQTLQATMVLKSLEEFNPDHFGLPCF